MSRSTHDLRAEIDHADQAVGGDQELRDALDFRRGARERLGSSRASLSVRLSVGDGLRKA